MKGFLFVIDIGKTNKKITLYDQNLRTLETRSCIIQPETTEGFRTEPIERITTWILDTLAELSLLTGNSPDSQCAIAVTTHGATCICLDDQGNITVPTLDYTTEVPDAVHQSFWKLVGKPHHAQSRTATAEIKPLVNCAKTLYFLGTQWPQDFKRTKTILFYPQYISWILAGVSASDYSYAGSHTYLWDFHSRDWSFVADRLNIRSCLPGPPRPSTDLLGTLRPTIASRTGLPAHTLVTVGIHDSNSSLIPYLITQNQDFVLNSTGTWCVAMHPERRVHFNPDEKGTMVYFNLSWSGQPIKTSILLGGLEYEHYTTLLRKIHNRTDTPSFDPAHYTDLTSQNSSFLLPSLLPSSGQFPDSTARIIDNGKVYPVQDITTYQYPAVLASFSTGLALINLSIAIQTLIALQRCGLKKGSTLFIEGGFRHNTHYLGLLACLLPSNPVFTSDLSEATSIGAALTLKALVEERPLESLADSISLSTQRIQAPLLPGLKTYKEEFLKYLQ